MKTARINLSKIDKSRIFQGKKGKYIDIVLVDHPNDYGDDGFISMSRTKEERENNTQTPIIGNWRESRPPVDQRQADETRRPSAPSQRTPNRDDDDDVPF